MQLKKLYRDTTMLEEKIKREDSYDSSEDSRVLLRRAARSEEAESNR